MSFSNAAFRKRRVNYFLYSSNCKLNLLTIRLFSRKVFTYLLNSNSCYITILCVQRLLKLLCNWFEICLASYNDHEKFSMLDYLVQKIIL